MTKKPAEPKKSRHLPITPYENFKNVNMLFLDSGAHSLHNQNQHAKSVKPGGSDALSEQQAAKLAKMSGQQLSALRNRSPHMFRDCDKQHAFANTPEFWQYVDEYSEYIKLHAHVLAYYVNVDVIFDPEKSWEVLKYMENVHGLRPLPVIHYGTDLKWLEKHIEANYEYIGIGGIGQGVSRETYHRWADGVFDLICSNKDRLPCVRTHGFAMTTPRTLWRYPWWSVDSSSWAKAAGFGNVLVPKKRNGEFGFKDSIIMSCSSDSPKLQQGSPRHLLGLPPNNLARRTTIEWLTQIGIPLGSIDAEGKMKEWGVVSHHAARKIANQHFFRGLEAALPEYPWPFIKPTRGKKFEF